MDFAELYTRYAKDVFRFAWSLSGDRELAEDIAAETFVRALTVGDRMRPGSVKAYLLAVARNLFLDSVRRRGHAAYPLEGHVEPPDPNPAADPEVTTAGRQALEATYEALQKVPERERAALLMAAVEGLPHEQIAAALGCSVAAVKVRVHRARFRLRRLMTGAAERRAIKLT